MQDEIPVPLNRPEHDDFWLLCEVVQDFDAASDDGFGIGRLAKTDESSLIYMALQRALRIDPAVIFNRPGDTALPAQARMTAIAAAAWIDGFVAGQNYGKRKSESRGT